MPCHAALCSAMTTKTIQEVAPGLGLLLDCGRLVESSGPVCVRGLADGAPAPSCGYDLRFTSCITNSTHHEQSVNMPDVVRGRHGSQAAAYMGVVSDQAWKTTAHLPKNDGRRRRTIGPQGPLSCLGNSAVSALCRRRSGVLGVGGLDIALSHSRVRWRCSVWLSFGSSSLHANPLPRCHSSPSNWHSKP
jgi:hypothetical protein